MPELAQPETLPNNKDDDVEIVTVALNPHAWVGVTSLISFAVVTVAILVYLLSDGGRDLFVKTVILRTYIADGTGLVKKALVEVDGIPVGHIDSVELSHSNEPSRVVLVRLAVDRKYLDSIPVDSRSEVTADNLLGDKYINIRKGGAHEAIKADDELLTTPPGNNFDPADLIASLRGVLKEANGILDQIDQPGTELNALVKGDQLYGQFRDRIAAIQKLVHAYGNPKSPIGQAIFGRDLYDQIRQPFLDVDASLSAIERGEGALGRAYAGTDQYDQARKSIADFHRTAAQWKDNKLLTDDETYSSLLSSLTGLTKTLNDIASGPMFTNEQLYESLNGASRSAAQFLSEFRKSPQKFLRIKIF